MIKNKYHSEEILGIRVDYVDGQSVNLFIKDTIENGRKAKIGNVNINAMNLSITDITFKNYTNSADLVFCDGKGIQLAFFLQRKPIPPHVTYEVWMWQLLPFCHVNGYKLYFLGSKPGVAERALTKIRNIYPTIQADFHHGYFDKDGKQNDEIIDRINNFAPHVLIVGFGMPSQEDWIEKNIESLNTNVVLNGGAYLDWISGDKRNCPTWMRNMGFEWLYRLMLEPKRLFRRYVLGNPQFIFRILKESYYA